MSIIYAQAKDKFSAYENAYGHYIKTQNVNMHYLSWGNPSDPCFIWIHGSMNNGYEMAPMADQLVASGFHVIAIDYYGHGQTAVPRGEISLYTIADDLKFLMDDLGINKAYIGGFSRGGYAATAFYDTYPNKVLGLVLEDGGSVAANTAYQKISPEALAQKAKAFDTPKNKPWDKFYPSAYEAFKSLYDPDDSQDQFSILALLKEETNGAWGIIYSKMMELFHLQSSQQFLDLTLRPTKVPMFARSMILMDPDVIFRNLNVPVLILDPVSEDDPMPFEKENSQLTGKHPEFIKHTLYPGIEHNIHYANPNKFLNDVISFLKDHK